MPPCKYDTSIRQEARLYLSALQEWCDGPLVIPYGGILICRKGTATLRINFDKWILFENTVITVFPNDVLILEKDTAGHDSSHANGGEKGDGFLVEILQYDASLLREASLQLEQTVYYMLREHRCSQGVPIVSDIINNMFRLLRIYFNQPECTCVTQLVLLQLKAFFIGFNDYMQRNPQDRPDEKASRRTRELFNHFMMLIERDYKTARDVNYYAEKLNITPKYLTNIVKTITNHTPKTIIDNFVILQLKMRLQMGRQSIKEIAWEFNFTDVSFFCRYFKRHTGKSPQQLRES